MKTFKVGDRVRVNKPEKVEGLPNWAYSMEYLNGSENLVTGVLENGNLKIDIWTLRPEWCELVEKAESKLKVGNIINVILPDDLKGRSAIIDCISGDNVILHTETPTSGGVFKTTHVVTYSWCKPVDGKL